MAGAQVARLRPAMITLGVRVVRSVRHLVLHLLTSHPEAIAWQRIALTLGVTTTA